MSTTAGQRYNQPTSSPTAKVTAFTTASAITAILIWTLGQFAGIDVPDGVREAMVILIGLVVAYFTKEKPQL